MTVFINSFEKSATKHQLAYRYGARKGNLTFFQNNSLNRGFHSLYEVEEEKSFEKMSQNQVKRTVLCERRKTFFNLYSTRHLQLSVDVKRRKYFHSQLNIWQLPFPIWSKENLLFHSWQKRHCMGS